jgi:hypothetical protein
MMIIIIIALLHHHTLSLKLPEAAAGAASFPRLTL